MPVAPIPQEQIDKVQSELRAELHLVDGALKERPVPVNEHLIDALNGTKPLYFRGRRFRVKNVGFAVGARLSVLEARLDNEVKREGERRQRRDAGEMVPLAATDVKEMLDILEESVAIFHSLVTPVGWIARLLWNWLPNPFEKATEKEIGELLGFFFACRMRSGVSFGSKPTGLRAPPSPSTSGTNYQLS